MLGFRVFQRVSVRNFRVSCLCGFSGFELLVSSCVEHVMAPLSAERPPPLAIHSETSDDYSMYDRVIEQREQAPISMTQPKQLFHLPS